MRPEELVQGYTYRIRTRIGTQKLEREHVLTYLGRSNLDGALSFNARPIGGTQKFYWEDITSITPECYNPITGSTRESEKHFMNKIVRPGRRTK